MNRKQHAALYLRMLAEGELRLQPRVLRLFKAQGNQVKKDFEAGGLEAALRKVDEDNKFERLLQAHYSRTIKTFAGYTKKQIKRDGQRGPLVFEQVVLEFIKLESLKQSDLINKNTKGMIKKALFKGEEEGLGINEIARNIRKEVSGIKSVYRSRMIARTETHSAATFGSQTIAESTGLEMEKEWVTSVDGRERKAHKDADRKRVSLKGKFFVGNEYIQRPGEGGAANRINCRCSLIYHPKI